GVFSIRYSCRPAQTRVRPTPQAAAGRTGGEIPVKGLSMTRVLVTGVGGGVGQSILKSLSDSPYAVVGADAEPLAAGLYAVPKAYRIPYAAAPDYVDRLIEVSRNE